MTDTTALLERYAALVEASPHNLLSKRALEELRTRHVPECVAFAALLPKGPGHVLDVGSGGGLPGMVVAIMRPDLQVTLLDATTKKTTFLRDAATELGLDVHVVNGRAEELRATLGGRFDVVTARAVARLDKLLGWTMPFLREGGLCYAIKGERWSEELAEATSELAAWRAEVVATPTDLHTTSDDTAPLVVILRRGQDVPPNRDPQ